MSDLDIDGNGISQFPLTMEAVFPIGPIGIPIRQDGTLGHAENVPRYSVSKLSGTNINTDNFLDPNYSGISAVIQSHQRDMYERPFIIDTVHNPRTTVPMPYGLFGAYREFVAEEKDDVYQISNVAASRA